MSAMKELYLRHLALVRRLHAATPETETAENRDSSTDAPASALPKTHPDQLPLFPPASCTAYCFDPSNQNTCFCDYEEYNPNPQS